MKTNLIRSRVMRAVVEHGPVEALFGMDEKVPNDRKLADIVAGLNDVSTAVRFFKKQITPQQTLIRIASYCMAWSIATSGDEAAAIEAVLVERERQTKLFLTGKIKFECSSPTVDQLRKFRVLVEEIGEVAEAIDQLEQAVKSKTRARALKHLNTELIHVAAVSVAWMESFEFFSKGK